MVLAHSRSMGRWKDLRIASDDRRRNVSQTLKALEGSRAFGMLGCPSREP
jgi:hypothetical protein